MSLFAELKRRKVIRVAVVYAATAFAVLQGADIMLPRMGVPDWGLSLVVALIVLGFPIALVLGWALELTPEGIKRTDAEPVPDAQAPAGATPALLGKRTVLVAGLLVAVGLGLSAGWLLKPDTAAVPLDGKPAEGFSAQEASIAVLPFVNMSGNPDNEYFSDGLTETLLHKLAQVSELKVAARTSSFAFKGQKADIRVIAEALNVAHVLEGSVQRAGDRVRITAQLIHATDGYHLWSEVFDRSLDDIFAVQDDIATQVASALRGSLLAEQEIVHDGGTQNAEAYDWYLRGRAALYALNADQLDDAVNAMRRAIALDPGFALAWAGLSQALEEQGRFSGRLDEVFGTGEIMESARTAARLAPDEVLTRVRLGQVLILHSDLINARPEIERALQIDPDNAEALVAMSSMLWWESRLNESLEYAERAMNTDPLDWNLKSDSVNKYMIVGRMEDAEELARSIVDHDPEYIPGLQALGNVYWRTGRHAEAFQVYHQLLTINPRTTYIVNRISDSFLALGDFQGALRWIERTAAINPEEADLSRAWIHFLRGEIDAAVAILEKMIREVPDDGESDLASRGRLHSELAMYQQDWTQLYEWNAKLLDYYTSRNLNFGALFSRLNMALAADRLGRDEERDRLLDAQAERLQQDAANGFANQYIWQRWAAVDGLRGDAASATAALETAFRLGFRERLSVLHDPVFDKVRDDPRMQALLDRIDEQNRTDLARLYELERALGDFEDAS
jgi:TolB-like protein